MAFHEREAGGRELRVNLRLREAHLFGRSEPARARPVLDDRNAPARSQRREEPARVGDATVDLLVDVREEDEVAAVRREPRIVEAGAHQHDVRELPLRDPPLEGLEHRVLDVRRVDAPRRSDDPREPFREVAGAGTHVGHDGAGAQAQRRDDVVRLLPGVAAGDVENRAEARVEYASPFDLVHDARARREREGGEEERDATRRPACAFRPS